MLDVAQLRDSLSNVHQTLTMHQRIADMAFADGLSEKKARQHALR